MSTQLKNTTITDGFVNNPDRVYFREYFEDLPQQILEFSLTQAAGSGNEATFSFIQPATGSFIKEAYVLCKQSPTFGSNGNIGITVGTGNFDSITGSGNIIFGNGLNNILSGDYNTNYKYFSESVSSI